MKKNLFLILIGFFIVVSVQAQTEEELKAERAEKQAELDAVKAEVDALTSQINNLPGWKYAAFGTIGFSLTSFSDWYAKEAPNSTAGNIGFTANGSANLLQEKFFWRNSGQINLQWVKFDDKDDPTDETDFQQAADVFQLSSLYGRKLSEKIAISGLGEYRTTLLSNFNDPGYLDLGVGATWTPISDLVVVFHPLNYNIVFADDETVYQSSLGCKIVADYTRSLTSNISWRSNLSAFISYEEAENLTNWTWVNGIGFKVWKGIGVGAELGLRSNKQETLDYEKNVLENPDATFDNIDNQLQSYWLLGLTYSF